jgi:predicted dehydrogenase
MNDIGVAVVGTGFMGWVHAEALRRVGVKMVGVLGSTAAKSRQKADRLAIQTAYQSYDDMLADDSVQAVEGHTRGQDSLY